MAATITATLDSTYRRVGVQLGGFAASGPVSVYRVHADGTTHLVRGVSALSGGAAFGWDYEATFTGSVTYYAMDGTTKVTSGAVSVGTTDAMLRAPGLPSFDVTIHPIAKPKLRRVRPQTVLRPWGRSTAIVLSDTAKSAEFEISLRTYSDVEANALLALYQQTATALLIMPNTRTDWQYVALGDLLEVPVVVYGRQPGDTAASPATWAEWVVPCVVVDQPVGGIYGDPTATYSAVAAAYPTYAALLAAKSTYLDLLRGV
ncbi:MAG: hypothetical protein M3067_10850 [Chloroflexota bacterium]|nr:hypothetical protein [Chloroflexota bacterium]